MMSRRHLPRIATLAASLLLAAVIGLVAAWLCLPYFHRQQQLGRLASSDLTERRRGLSHLVRHAGTDPALLAGSWTLLRRADTDLFVQIVAALGRAGQWRRPPAPDDLYLRWLNMLANDGDAEARILAAQRAIELRDSMQQPNVAALLGRLLEDETADVRYNALITVAELAAISSHGKPFGVLALAATRDPNSDVARHATIFARLLGLAEDGVGSGIVTRQIPHKLPDLPENLRPFLINDDPAVRDLACVVAVDRYQGAVLDDFVASLLNDFNDRAKMCGAVTAGLTGVQSELLSQKQDAEDVWTVKQVYRLGLWMQGRWPGGEALAGQLVAKAQMPRTTVLLTMLHADRVAALDYLLNPRGQPRFDLIDLLGRRRWWLVLRRYLPSTAPPLAIDAKQYVAPDQIDVLRNWHLVNRHRMASP